MLGALYGDVIGSHCENHCTMDFGSSPERDSTFTDDSVLTAAVCRAILADPAPINRLQVSRRARV